MEIKQYTKEEILKLIDKIAEELSFEPALIKAIVMTESSFNQFAETPYARGLMQISKPALATVNGIFLTGYKWEQLFNAEVNITVGTLYLDWLYDYFSTKFPENEFIEDYVVMSYNWGVGNVVKWLLSTKASNNFIDENVPEETKSHLFDTIWWYNYFKRGEAK